MSEPVASVLVVDDDADSCEVLVRFLVKAGHSARCVHDGREALAALSDAVPDFILVDVRMPVMDGVALVEVIRSCRRWSAIPMAVVTAYPEDYRLGRLDGLGVRRVFRKSEFRFEDVLEWMVQAAIPPAGAADLPPDVRP